MTTVDCAAEPTCDHGYGPVTGVRHFLTVVYTRPWRRLFRKTYWRRCWRCDLRERVTP